MSGASEVGESFQGFMAVALEGDAGGLGDDTCERVVSRWNLDPCPGGVVWAVALTPAEVGEIDRERILDLHTDKPQSESQPPSPTGNSREPPHRSSSSSSSILPRRCVPSVEKTEHSTQRSRF